MKRWLIFGGTLLAWLAVCFWIRFSYIEIEVAADPCRGDPAGLACRFRQLMGMWFYWQVVGKTALVLALLAWLRVFGKFRAGIAFVAVLLSAWALVFYNVNPGSLAMVMALAALANRWRLVPGATAITDR